MEYVPAKSKTFAPRVEAKLAILLQIAMAGLQGRRYSGRSGRIHGLAVRKDGIATDRD
jgi:hypothetical protein